MPEFSVPLLWYWQVLFFPYLCRRNIAVEAVEVVLMAMAILIIARLL
jgi:hypothetical protein